MDTTLSYLICLSCLPQTVHTSRDCAVLNVMGQYTVDQDTAGSPPLVVVLVACNAL